MQIETQKHTFENKGSITKKNSDTDIDQYLFSDENYNGQNSMKEERLYDSKRSQQSQKQSQPIQNSNKKHTESIHEKFDKQQLTNQQHYEKDDLENEDIDEENQNEEYNQDRNCSNSNDNDSCLESKSLKYFNNQNKERIKEIEMQQQQNFKTNSLSDRNNSSPDKNNVNYLQTSLNYCNKTKDEIQEIIEGIPYPDQLSMTSISNSTYSQIGSTPQRTLGDNNDFRQSKKSLMRGSFNRFNEMQRNLPIRLQQNAKKKFHNKTEGQEDDLNMNEIGQDWSKSNVQPGDDKNIFPSVHAPSIELSNENSMIMKVVQTSNDLNYVQKLNLATFGGFDTRHDEDTVDDYDETEVQILNQNTGNQIKNVQNKIQNYEQQLNQQNQQSQKVQNNLNKLEDIENEDQYYTDEDRYSQQQRQFESKSQKNSKIMDNSRNVHQNNISNYTQHNIKSLNLVDKSRSQNFSLQEEQINSMGYQNHSEHDESHFNDELTSHNNTYHQIQNQKMQYNYNGQSQITYSDNQIDASYLSVPQQDQSVIQHLQQQQNQTINFMRRSDDESDMRIQISQLTIERNQLINKTNQLIHQVNQFEQEKNYQISQIEDLNQELKFLKEKYKDNGNLEKLRGRELESERLNSRRLKQMLDQKNDKIQSLFDEMQNVEQQREAYMIEFEQQREIKQMDQQVFLEYQLQMQSIQEENDRLIIRIEQLETEIQTKDFNIESMRQTYQQREKIINNELNKNKAQYQNDVYQLKQEINSLNKAKELNKQRQQVIQEYAENDETLKKIIGQLGEEVEELRTLNEAKKNQIEFAQQELHQYKDEVRRCMLLNFSYWINTEEFKNSEFSIMVEILRSYVQELSYENEGLSHSVKQNNKQKIDSISELRKLKNENNKLKDDVLNFSTYNEEKVNMSSLSKGMAEDKQQSVFFNEQINKLNNQLFMQRQDYETQINNINQQYKEIICQKQNSLDQTLTEIQDLKNENERILEEITQLRQMTKIGENIITELENKLKKQQLPISNNSKKNDNISSHQEQDTIYTQNENQQKLVKDLEQKQETINQKEQILLKKEQELSLREGFLAQKEENLIQQQEIIAKQGRSSSQKEEDMQMIESEINSQRELQKNSQKQQSQSDLIKISQQDIEKNVQKETDQMKNLQISLKREVQEKDLLKIENDHLIEQIENKEKEISQRDTVMRQLEEKTGKQERILKDEKKKQYELQKENKVLLDNINHLKTNYEKMQTQLQQNINQLNHKQLELQSQIKNTIQLSKKNKNLSQTNLELLSKIQNLNDQMNNFEKERHFTSQPSPIYHNKAKSCQYTSKGVDQLLPQRKKNGQNHKRNISVNSVNSSKRDKSLLYLIQNTLNNSSDDIRQSTFPNEYPNNNNDFDIDKRISHPLNQTHPSQNNISLESFCYNPNGDIHLNKNNNQINNSNHKIRQNSHKNLMISEITPTQQNGKNNLSQNKDQFESLFNNKPTCIQEAFEVISFNSQLKSGDKQSKQEQKNKIQNKYINLNSENFEQDNNFNQQLNSQTDEPQLKQKKETESKFLAMKLKVDNYEIEFNQMKEFFIDKLKDVNKTIKDLELQKNIQEKENQDLRQFKADYYTQISQLEQQKSIFERQIYNNMISQKQMQNNDDENLQYNNPLTITPEMLSAEETLELLQEILRKVVKSNEMKKILVKSSDLKNLIQLLQHQQYGQSQVNNQNYNTMLTNTSHHNISVQNNNQSEYILQNNQSNFLSNNSQPQYYYGGNNQSINNNPKMNKIQSSGAYLNNNSIESYQTNIPNQYNNYATLQSTNSTTAHQNNNSSQVNKQLFKHVERKQQGQLQRSQIDQNRNISHSNNIVKYQSNRNHQSQQIYPINAQQPHYQTQQNNQQNIQNNIQPQLPLHKQNLQNNYFSVQEQNVSQQVQPSQFMSNTQNRNINQNIPLSSRRDKKQQFLSLDQNIISQ